MTRVAGGLRVGCAAAAVALFAVQPAPAADKTSCAWTDVERIVAVGDVHGAYDRFVEILKTVGLIDANLHWAGGKTHFVQLGDVVDRGADSRKALDLLRQLEREAPAAGGMVHPLLGNHEVMRMLGDTRYVTPGEYAAFSRSDSESTRDSYLNSSRPATDRDQVQKMPLGFLEMRLAFGRDGEYGRWLRQNPATVTIDGFVFLHGGISPAFAATGCEAINQQLHRELTSDLDKTRAAPLNAIAGRADGPLWYRGLAQLPESLAPQVEETIAKLHARAIVVAHTVAPTGRVTVRFGGRVIVMDTGMQQAYVPDGRASALEIVGETVTAVYVDRQDVLTVAGTQNR
jgi:hypothetical protein